MKIWISMLIITHWISYLVAVSLKTISFWFQSKRRFRCDQTRFQYLQTQNLLGSVRWTFSSTTLDIWGETPASINMFTSSDSIVQRSLRSFKRLGKSGNLRYHICINNQWDCGLSFFTELKISRAWMYVGSFMWFKYAFTVKHFISSFQAWLAPAQCIRY